MILTQNLWFADDIDALRKAGDELCEELLAARLAREARGETIARRPRMERWDANDFYDGEDCYGF